MTTLTHQMSLLAEAFEKLIGNGRTDVFRRVSRMSRKSFRTQLSTSPPQSHPLSPSSQPPSPRVVANGSRPSSPSRFRMKRKASLEGIVKQLTSLAVSISTDDVKNKGRVAGEMSSKAARILGEDLVASSDTRRGSGSSLPGTISKLYIMFCSNKSTPF